MAVGAAMKGVRRAPPGSGVERLGGGGDAGRVLTLRCSATGLHAN